MNSFALIFALQVDFASDPVMPGYYAKISKKL